ncbi:MAG: RNA polymerase subunit sigma-24 [Micavibrio sp.]|nr:RNA polymerase subunit sigma-24 [Micavibrio sp.]|tara:strand:+ start:1022 stop:1564 length:543 start_codon:yes stop_codon:yes gene_type:complete
MGSDSSKAWPELMAKAQKGDKFAYNRLLSEILPYIHNVLYKKISKKEAIDDIVQEILISVHKSRATYDSSRAFKPWLHAIISYRSMDYFRKHYAKRSQQVENIDFTAFENDFVTNSDHAGEYIDIENALDSLPKKQRKIFDLMRIKGFTAQEVADKMNMSVSAVKVSVHRTAQKLEEKLK